MVKFKPGFSLIEVLVALFIFSLSMVGLSQLLIYGVTVSHQALYLQKMTLLASSLIEEIRRKSVAEDFITKWQTKMKEVALGCELRIEKTKKEEQCIYTIIILPPVKEFQTLQFQVVT
jgi:prepilin-type N-terminal cleavage/methylation domain-containing protein